MRTLLPRQGVPIAGGGGMASNPFYAFLQDVERAINSGVAGGQGLADAVAAIARALGSPDGSVANIPEQSQGGGQILGPQSVHVNGALPNMVQIVLEGDAADPGPTFRYGTDAEGAKGWFPIADALVGSNTAALTVGADGVVTFSLPELPNTGGGTLQKTARDQYGRLAGTSEATTDDLPEGENLYFTDGRAQAAVVTQSITPGDTTHSPSGDAVFDALAGKEPSITAGSAGQFYRGDKTWVNELLGDMIFRSNSVNNEYRKASISASPGNDNLMGLNGYGANGSADALGGTVNLRTAEAWTATANGCNFEVRLVTPGTTSLNVRFRVRGTGVVAPAADNTQRLGAAVERWSEVYAGNGVINTSDVREKEVRGPLNEQEIACAIELASAAVIYQWKAAIAEKGEAARLHCSPTVQSVMAIMASHGLDPFRYGFVCYDEWGEQPEIRDEWPDEYDDEGNLIREAGSEVTQEYRPAGDRYSLRPSELQSFIAAGMAHRIAQLEARLAALGSE